MFIYPDRPASVLGPDFLDQIDPDLYFCTLKIDGWRCVVRRENGVITYTSRANKPIDVPGMVRGPFEATLFGKGDYTLDCELTGKRRTGDVNGIVVLELLEHNGTSYRKHNAIDRWTMAYAMCPEYTVPGELHDFTKFFRHHKANTPLAEGVVLKLRQSKLIGSTIACAENSAWIKCKWRAGSSGLAPTEIV